MNSDRLDEIQQRIDSGWYFGISTTDARYLLDENVRLRSCLRQLVDATDAVLDNYHYEHRQGCGGTAGSPPGDSYYCSIVEATEALAAAGVLLNSAETQ